MSLHTSTPLTFILGGARSGKSDYALSLAREIAGDAPILFVATAQGLDEEMRERINRHQAERPTHWQTLEAPLDVGLALVQHFTKNQDAPPAAIVLDCVTLLVSNVLFAGDRSGEDEPFAETEARLEAEIDALLSAAHEIGVPLIVISNEVGLGIVPAGRVSRVYRDLMGRVNRRLVAEAERALFLVAGVPLDLGKLRADF